MRYGIIALLVTLMFSSPAFANHKHHHHYQHHAHHVHIRANNPVAAALGVGLAHMLERIKTVETEAGPIKVAARWADNFKALIHDFILAGYHPHYIGCFARGGHVRHSKHYLGEACDFDQTGWGRTNRFMYSHLAAQLIAKHGLSNGCDFHRHDCGHVGTDLLYARRSHRVRYARAT